MDAVKAYRQRRYRRLLARLDGDNRFDYGVPGMKWGVRKERLTTSEERGLRQYKSFESYIINDMLRNIGYDNMPDEYKQMVDDIDAALEKLDSYKGEIFRVLQIDDEVALAKFLDEHKTGNTVRYPSYTSFSKRSGYNDDANIYIRVPESRNGKDMDDCDNGEDEVLYGRDSSFVVESLDKSERGYTIVLSEV